MKNDIIDRIIRDILTIIMIFIPLVKLIDYTGYKLGFLSNTMVLNQAWVLWLLLPCLIVMYLVGIITKKYKFNYVDYIIIIIIILNIFSTIFALDRDMAIFGATYRNEGILSLLSYYFIFLNVKNMTNKQYKKQLVNIFIYVGVFQAIYGILQVFTPLNIVKHYNKLYMAMGLCGNPNFFGSYIIMLLFICLVNYLKEGRVKDLILSILFFISLCTCESTGPFLSFVISILFMIVVFRKQFDYKKIILILGIFILSFILTNNLTVLYNKKVNKSSIEPAYMISKEISYATSNDLYQKSASNITNGSRFIVWKNSIPLMKKYWYMGCGPDNFGKAYPYNSRQIYYDKAHNVYIEMGVTNGLIVLSLYCFICLVIFIKGLKYKDTLSIGLYMAFVAYSVQAFANINIIDVTPIFYMILGLLYSINDNSKKSRGVKAKKEA